MMGAYQRALQGQTTPAANVRAGSVTAQPATMDSIDRKLDKINSIMKWSTAVSMITSIGFIGWNLVRPREK